MRELNGITDQQACYSFTFTVVDWVDVFIRPVYKREVVSALNEYIEHRGLVVYAWCLMTNHLHFMAQTRNGQGISFLTRELKKFTTQRVFSAIDIEPDYRREWMLKRFELNSVRLKRIEKFQLWQDSCNAAHIDLAQPSVVKQQLEHIHENPVRDEIVESAADYLYSSARDYEGFKGLIRVRRIQLPGLGMTSYKKLDASMRSEQQLRN